MPRKFQISVGDVIYRFLAFQKGQGAKGTYNWYRNYLLRFADKHGRLPIEQLTSSIVHQWLSKYPDGSKHNAARTVVRAMNWAVQERIISTSPLGGFRKPPQTRREKALTAAEYAKCLRAMRETKRIDGILTLVQNRPLADAIKFLWHTGCRPQELRVIESQWVEGPKIVLPRALSKGKRNRRVIYLDDMASKIVARRSQQYPTGPIFRNSADQPWRMSALALSFRRLGKRLEIPGLCAYNFRHSRITRWLENGKDVATIAALAGNSPRMVLEQYNHVAQNEKRLLDELGD
jgi:integrase